MINWLKYYPIRFRFLDRDYDAEYQGPSFSQAKPITLLAGGNTIRLKVPKHKTTYDEPPIYVKSQDGMDTGFESYHSSVATKNWEYSTLVFRCWDYLYAWFRGRSGMLSMHISIVTRAENKAFTNTSFFHPRSFEFILTNYLNTQFGHEHSLGVADYRAPVNWQVHQQLPVFSASFEVGGINKRLFYVFPITDTHFVELSFSLDNEDKLREEMKVVAKEIIQSVILELGAQSQAQWDRVKAECSDMQLSEHFAPLQWPIKPEDIETSSVVAPFMAHTEQLAKL